MKVFIFLICLLASAACTNAQTASARLRGKVLYETYCAACHQPDGEGVPRLNPALMDSKALLSKDGTAIRIVLLGSKASYQREESHGNQMPNQSFLKDEEIALILNYARNAWGNKAAVISKQQVAAERKKLKR